MNSKGHLIVSLVKSIVRIIGGYIAIATMSVQWLAFSLIIAEMLGLLEELVDKR